MMAAVLQLDTNTIFHLDSNIIYELDTHEQASLHALQVTCPCNLLATPPAEVMLQSQFVAVLVVCKTQAPLLWRLLDWQDIALL